MGQLTSGVAHDFNDLLTVVLGNVAFLEKGLAKAGIDGKLAQRLGCMRAAAERGARLTDQLLSFSRRQRLEPKVIDLNETVAGMRDFLESTMGGGMRIETQLADDLWLALVDLTQLELAVLNLSINARDAMEMGGTLSVGTANVQLGPSVYPVEPQSGDYVAVHVTDTGAGTSKEVRSKAFERFLHDQGNRQGLGAWPQSGLGFRQAIRRGRAHPFGCWRGYDHRNLPAARRRQTGQDRGGTGTRGHSDESERPPDPAR